MFFRAFISALLMILILPWGAYGMGHAGSDLRMGHSQGQEITSILDAKGAELKARSSCRIAVLPGAPCGPDPVVPDAFAAKLRATQPGNPPHLHDWEGQGRSLAPPRAPPRMV